MSVSETLKTKRTELQTLLNQFKTLHAELEQRKPGSDGADPVTADERQKLATMFEAGKKIREQVDQLDFVADEEERNQPQDRKTQDRLPQAQGRKTAGQIAVESKQYKENNGREMQPVSVPGGMKALYGATEGTGGGIVGEDRRPEIIDIARQRPRSVVDLVNQAETSSDAVTYMEMNSRTNNAAVVPEYTGGNFGLKPESDLTFDEKTAPVKTIATWIAASRQILADAPRLRSMVDGELLYMVEVTLENQILTGDGTGSNFTGMINWSGIQSRVHAVSGRGFDAADKPADTIRRAITDIQLDFYEATGIVLYPGDAEALELTKDSTGQYVNVFDPVAQRLWRVPVVSTPAMTDGTSLVGNFRLGATLWDRMEAEIRVGEPNDFFLRNAVAVLAELRAAFAVTRPRAIERITGL